MTGTHEIAVQLGGDRRAELCRFLIASTVAHLGLVAAFAFSPESRISVPRGVVAAVNHISYWDPPLVRG